jgi:cysteinyl-tRNA synthetase
MKESYRPGIFDKGHLDEQVNILDEDAFEMARRLATEEGLFVGMSSGAAMHVAAQKAREMAEGVIVVIFPDGGERYLSTDLFADRQETTLRLFNALTRSKDLFRPMHREEILMHSCGPAVHEVPHIGSYRRFVVSDIIKRYLMFKGYRVRHQTNIIDLADRSIKGAERAQLDLATHAELCTNAFLKDLDKLHIIRDPDYPKASEHVDDMLRVVERLVDKGYAYEKLKSVYFDISKLESYGQLSNIDQRKMRHGRTVDLDNYEKDNPADFTLLKRSTLSELKQGIYFKTQWGNMRPSWHLECAAISMKYLGEVFDIHASGADILFPHCENVLAIGKATTGKVMSRYWINTDLLMVAGKKMSRSLDNVLTVDDLERKGYHGREIRFFLLGAHYRKPLNYSLGAMETAKNTVRKLDRFIQRLYRSQPGAGFPDTDQLIYDVRQGFNEVMDDDLYISGALAALFAFVSKISAPLANGTLSLPERDRVLDVMRGIDSVLGILNFHEETIDDEVQRLISQRDTCREAGKWAEADAVRQKILEMGVEICDTPNGTFGLAVT